MWGIVAGYAAVALLFASGETQSALERAHSKIGQQLKPDLSSRLRMLKPVQVPLLVVGIALFGVAGAFYSGGIVQNIGNVLSDPFLLVSGVVFVLAVSILAIKWQTRGGRTTMV